ncbi:hypothetical protein Q3G72_029421 [Acer saccharum]|nr:hypothetical protein Q3G72_027976 [Acer saccharum]KAK1560662.1 hypothetical protein Q3G72_029421 [Acer saccharum]
MTRSDDNRKRDDEDDDQTSLSSSSSFSASGFIGSLPRNPSKDSSRSPSKRFINGVSSRSSIRCIKPFEMESLHLSGSHLHLRWNRDEVLGGERQAPPSKMGWSVFSNGR